MRKSLIVLLVVFLAFFAQWLLMPGKLECTGDGPSHADSVWFYGHSLKNFLRVPWTNPFFFSGSSFSVFYFSLLYAAAGILSTILNYILALKIIIIFSYALSLYSMRLLAKEHGLDEKESLMAGLLYAFSNWIVFTTFFRGAYLDVIAYPFLPFAFLYIRRGLDRELVPFIASTFLLAVSFQNSLYFLLPALVFYALMNRAGWSHIIYWAASLTLLLAFFAVPFASLRGETLIRTEFSSPAPSISPVNLVIPQWGWFYPEYEKYVPHFVELDSVYAGALHVALALLGIFYFWKGFPAMVVLLLYSLGFLLGIFPSLLLMARTLFLMNVPLAIFIPLGMRKVIEMGRGKKAAILAFAALLNAAGIAVLARVYLTRAKFMAVSDAWWAYLPAALVLAGGFAILLLLRANGWKQKYMVAAIAALLLLETLPNAINPTMAFPTPTQIDPCSYRSVGEHEFVANSFCAMPCGKVYSYRAGLIGPANLTAEYMRMSEASSTCSGELSLLGVRYCFSKGQLTEMEPAPFVNSTSRYTIEMDEPDHLAIRFDGPGHTKVRLGYFSFYRAFAGGWPIKLEQSREGFIEFDNPAGRVDLKVVPPGSFAYSYLVSALAGLGLVWFLLGKRKGNEARLLALSCLPILVHVLLRLFWMLL